ncbi:hypothetical protein Tco_0345244 [Tanacetum coccineum]
MNGKKRMISNPAKWQKNPWKNDTFESASTMKFDPKHPFPTPTQQSGVRVMDTTVYNCRCESIAPAVEKSEHNFDMLKKHQLWIRPKK